MPNPRTTATGSLVSRGEEFKTRLDAARASVQPLKFEWYRYDSLGNLGFLDAILKDFGGDLVALSGGDPVLDFGCADGDLAFFLESLGLHVLSFDHVSTNHNGMLGVRALKKALDSNVEIHELNLDSNFRIPPGQYGLALVLGILYHLKNPFYVLETLSRQAKYCILSTRITRFLPDRKTDVSKTPMAYLLDEKELNGDCTNFWIFSDAGLRRIVERSNWRVLKMMTLGDTAGSDPVSLDHDERAFLLLESVYGMGHLNLLEGWHPPEPEGWRWTAKRFTVRLSGVSSFSLKIFVPPEWIERFGSISISAEANGQPMEPETYHQAGDAFYSRRLPSKDPVEVAFTVSESLAPTGADERELGIIVARLDTQ